MEEEETREEGKEKRKRQKGGRKERKKMKSLNLTQPSCGSGSELRVSQAWLPPGSADKGAASQGRWEAPVCLSINSSELAPSGGPQTSAGLRTWNDL